MQKQLTGSFMARLKASNKKVFENDEYRIIFDPITGIELLYGINGNDDPFVLELPSMLDVGIMGSCSNACEFCYQGNKDEPHMVLKNYKNIIDQVFHHTNQVALGGRGDPNQHPEFEQILEYSRLHNVTPNYTTSGINLTDEQIQVTKKYCGAVAVSYHGKDYTYSAIERLHEAGVKTNIHFIYSNASHDLTFSLLKGEDWDSNIDMNMINATIFLLFKPQGNGSQLLERIPSINQLIELSNLIINPSCKGKVGMDSCLANHIITYTDGKLPKLMRMAMDTCEGGRMSAYISPSMLFMPCSFADHSVGIPLDSKNLGTIWKEGKSFTDFRDKLTVCNYSCPLGF